LLYSLNSFEVSQYTNDIKLAKTGNKEAFCRIINENKNQLYKIAKSIIFIECDIEDALQETILKAWLQICNLKKDKFFKSWLIRILINECYGILRKRSKVTNLSEIIAVDVSSVDSNEKIDISNALKSLSYELRVVVVLFYFEDMSYKEIALTLNIAEGTVKSRLSRAKIKLEINLDYVVGGK
jgi:RNA polymerase sigma-70 factor (ECF subfamily)